MQEIKNKNNKRQHHQIEGAAGDGAGTAADCEPAILYSEVSKRLRIKEA